MLIIPVLGKIIITKGIAIVKSAFQKSIDEVTHHYNKNA
jgi:hypothetical protein